MNKVASDHLPSTNPGEHRSEQNERLDQTSKMELDWSYIEERQRGTLCHSVGVEGRREKNTGSTKNNMEEHG